MKGSSPNILCNEFYDIAVHPTTTKLGKEIKNWHNTLDIRLNKPHRPLR